MLSNTVIGGSASAELAKKLAKKVGATYIEASVKTFPDGEIKITVPKKPKKGKIIVVNSTCPPVDSNLMQTLCLVFKARDFSDNVVCVIPYMGYARQDREFLSGEVVTLSVVAKLLKAAGASRVIVIDIHSKLGLGHFKIPIKNLTAVGQLANYFKKMKLKNPLVVSPDMGGLARAKEFARLVKTEFIALQKHRDRKTGNVQIKTTNLSNVKGRDLILVDDMVSTGGSIIKATEFLKRQGCRRVFVACTHALLVNNAETKMKKAGVSQIISTNTIPASTAKVDVSGIISKAI